MIMPQPDSVEEELAELLRQAGVQHLADMPLDAEVDIQQLLRKAGDSIVPRLAKGLADRDPGTRQKVATYLGQIGTPACVAPLVGALADREPQVRLLAVISLRDCGEVSAVPALIPLVADVDERVRGAAADAFSGLTNSAHGCNPFGDAAACNASSERLRDWWLARQTLGRDELWAEGFRARGYAVEALDARSAPGLIDALGDGLPFVRRNAQLALGRLAGEPRTLDDEIVQIDPGGERPYAEVREEALERLRDFYRQRLETGH